MSIGSNIRRETDWLTTPIILVAMGLAGQLLGFLVTLAVARRLELSGFEAYVFAAAVFLLLAPVAPLGSERHAVKALPPLLQHAPAATGLIRFGVERTLMFALPATAAVAVWALAIGGEAGAALLVTALSLPAGAMAHYGVDLLTALGRPRLALLLFRVLVPLTALLTVLLVASLTSPLAIGGWGLGWLCAVGGIALAAGRRMPRRLPDEAPRREAGWARETRPFLVYRLSMAALAQAPLLVLGLAAPSDGAVGAYAAASATAGLITVLASSTNRAYGRQLSGLLAAGDRVGIAAARGERLRWLVPAVALTVGLLWAAPDAVLGLFRPEFAETGAWSLRILAGAAGFTVLFALAPTWTKFRGQTTHLYRLVAGAAVTEVLLLVLLVPCAGATGAALAHAASMIGLYLFLSAAAARDLRDGC